MSTNDTRPELWQIVQLLDVSLQSSRAERRCTPSALWEPPPNLVLDWSATAENVEGMPRVRVEARFAMRAEHGPREQLLSVEATYEVLYSRPEEIAPTEDELRSFASINGVFNAWPYWRELLHSTLGKMNLVLPPVPVFRPGMMPEPPGQGAEE